MGYYFSCLWLLHVRAGAARKARGHSRTPMKRCEFGAFFCGFSMALMSAGCGADASSPERTGAPKPTRDGTSDEPAPSIEAQAPITMSSFSEISGRAPDDIWTVGADGVTAHYDGKSWSVVPSGTTENLLGVWTAAKDDAWAVGDTEVLIHWDGSSWSPVVAPASGVLIGVWGSSSSDVWAVGIDDGSGFVRRWDGAHWDYNWLDFAPSFWDVWGTSANDVWTVGSAGPDTGHIFRFDGTQLSQMPFDGPPLRSIHGTSANDVWVVAQESPMEHWDGNAWTIPDGPPIKGTMVDVWAGSPTDAWACGTYGQMIHWDGTSWSDVDVGFTGTLQGIWGTAGGDVWAVGAAGTILHYDGKSWISAFE